MHAMGVAYAVTSQYNALLVASCQIIGYRALWATSFLDIRENAEWPRFLAHLVYDIYCAERKKDILHIYLQGAS